MDNNFIWFLLLTVSITCHGIIGTNVTKYSAEKVIDACTATTEKGD